MLLHPQFDPVAIAIGPLKIHWYGLCYVLAFTLFYWLGRSRAGRRPWEQWTVTQVEDLVVWGIFGVVVGGRLGFVLFYQPHHYLQHPLEIFALWRGGMSFHGGMLGTILALWMWARKRGLHWLAVTDFVAPLVPIGLAAGRLGNFINGELPGRPTDVPWAMVFPQVDHLPRHPSQLYQLALEGLLLFAFLWWFSSRPRPLGAVSAAFLMGYALLRFVAEFTRQPDAYLGLLAGGLTMGQWLSLPMFIIGAGMMAWSHRKKKP